VTTILRIGIFHPPINVCGGAEWVATKITNTLRSQGHNTVFLANKKIDQRRIKNLFGEEIFADREIPFHFEPFATTDLHNIYTDGLRTLFLKSKCDLVIDTQSNGILPGVNISYIHFPIFGRLASSSKYKNKTLFFGAYGLYERARAKKNDCLLLANSKYTCEAIRKHIGVAPFLLYPPISNAFFTASSNQIERENVVVALSRIAPGKNLTLIPCIAKMTDSRIRFHIVGLRESEEELNKISKLAKKLGVSNRVQITTDLSREKLPDLLRRSKVYLHLAQGEHFGVSIAEAMAAGCIPVVHDSGGPREFVPDSLRYKEYDDAAWIIEKSVLEWNKQESLNSVLLAQSFIEDKFSRTFLNLFNSYARGIS
jgi:alpha-1,2-mannosyltransferase